MDYGEVLVLMLLDKINWKSVIDHDILVFISCRRVKDHWKGRCFSLLKLKIHCSVEDYEMACGRLLACSFVSVIYFLAMNRGEVKGQLNLYITKEHLSNNLSMYNFIIEWILANFDRLLIFVLNWKHVNYAR